MIQISQLKLPYDHTKEELINKIAKMLRCSSDVFTYEIIRQSLDARNKREKKYVYTIHVFSDHEKKIMRHVKHKNVTIEKPVKYRFPKSGNEELHTRPVIVGSGPAGLFCAWYLARAGYCPIVLERGYEALKRKKAVDAFWESSILDPVSNVQFGEGGAGTFSDGKLNTLVKDPAGRNKEVLKRFVSCGAPESIVYSSKPHLGTDRLIQIVQTMREEIIEMGGSVRFASEVTDLLTEDGRISGVVVNGSETITAELCVLAIGHSARDTFEMLHAHEVYMEPKSFAVGVRIEHEQKTINQAMYGEDTNEILGAAPYKVTHRASDGRGVYSFCMCPGGYVVNASSEEEALAVNGMSYQARDSRNANSALIVSVSKEDFGYEGPLGGMYFQRDLEKAAYRLRDGAVPIQRYQDFKENRESTSLGHIVPCIKGAYALANLRSILPKYVGNALVEGIEAFGASIPGYNDGDAVLSGVESRTSSPVRIVRDQNMNASIKNIYPCGEGAGYAGGITSAAMDGLKTAEAIAARFAPPELP